MKNLFGIKQLNQVDKVLYMKTFLLNFSFFFHSKKIIGINIVTTDKVVGSNFAKIAGGGYFSHPTYTFKYDTGQEVDIAGAPSGDLDLVIL